MKELNRQVVIFGDFKSIGFDAVVKMSKMINKYKLNVDAAPDFIFNNGLNGALQINNFNIVQQSPFTPQPMRPVLVSEDRSFSVFIGATRIHVEENNAGLDSYNEFLEKAKDILQTIVSIFNNVYINRMAVNGKIILEDLEKMSQIFKDTFKKSHLYGEYSDEFSFRINTKIRSVAINSEINKIISYSRNNEILPSNEIKPIMFIDYDYNTIVKEDSRFNMEHLDLLIKEGTSFKSSII